MLIVTRHVSLRFVNANMFSPNIPSSLDFQFWPVLREQKVMSLKYSYSLKTAILLFVPNCSLVLQLLTLPTKTHCTPASIANLKEQWAGHTKFQSTFELSAQFWWLNLHNLTKDTSLDSFAVKLGTVFLRKSNLGTASSAH